MHFKHIGTGFLFLALLMSFIGGWLAMAIQAELDQPGIQYISPPTYINFVHYHGLIMTLGVVLPGLLGFMLRNLNKQIDTRDTILPKSGYIYLLMYTCGLGLLISAMVVAIQTGAVDSILIPDPGAFESPTYVYTKTGKILIDTSLMFMMVTLCITIILKKRGQVSPFKAPPLVWSIILITSIVALPLFLQIMGTVAELVLPISYSERMNIYHINSPPWHESHTTMLLMLMALFGLNTHIVMAMTSMKVNSLVMNVIITIMLLLILMGWLPELLQNLSLDTVDLDLMQSQYFKNLVLVLFILVYVSGLVPMFITLIKVRPRIGPELLFIIASYIFIFMAGYQGALLGAAPKDFQFHDTWYATGHFHYAFIGIILALIGYGYHMFNEWGYSKVANACGYVHFLTMVVAAHALFRSYSELGLQGMPRQFPDYPLAFSDLHSANTNPTIILLGVQLLFVVAILAAWIRYKITSAK